MWKAAIQSPSKARGLLESAPIIEGLICDYSFGNGMKHLAVGIFHGDALARELGKKDTESDLVMLNRKTDQHILTFMYPFEDKLTAKSQIISSIDAAIVAFNQPSRELGETLVMLDALGVSRGIAVTSPYATTDQVASLTKGTSVRSFVTTDMDPVKVLSLLESSELDRDKSSPLVVVVDHSFSVKGVGEVILGFVKKGVVRKYGKLLLQPANKEVIVRSIQMQDEDFDEATAGARVGLAIKGATIEDMGRGSILCDAGAVKTATSLNLSFEKTPFYSDEVREGAYHATVGMQTFPIMISEKNDTSIMVKSEKPFAYADGDTFLLLDLNAKKMRVMGRARLSMN